jgi:uncharacterized membrane protein
MSQKETEWIKRSIILFFIGFFIILVGVVITVSAALLFGGGRGSASIGGFILIGPFPIVFGAGPEAPWIALIAIILGILTIILFLVLWRRKI